MNYDLSKCGNISVYLGGNCNFDCDYCDRGPIKEAVGYTQMTPHDVPSIMRFLKDVASEDGKLPVDMISFFGGEPFVFIKVMDKIIEESLELWPDMKFLIQTNGSNIIIHEDFIKRYGKSLHVSISYDFNYQGVNRTVFDIDRTLEILKENGCWTQMQYVMPVMRPDCFSVDNLATIVKMFGKYKINRLSLIALRHLRGPGRFKTFIDDVPLEYVMQKYVQWVQLLHVYGINAVVDGMIHDIEKSYFDNHKQLIMAPDGYLYPEYDFVEYKIHGARIGEWKNQTLIERKKDDSHLMHDRCHDCPARNKCGIKYLYKMWADAPDENCLKASQVYEFIIRHNLALKKVGNIANVIGIEK